MSAVTHPHGEAVSLPGQAAGQQAGAAAAPVAPQPPIPTLPPQPGQATSVGGTAQGQPGTTAPDPFRDRGSNDDIPDEIIPLVGMIMGIVMTMVIMLPIARAIGRWIDRRTDRTLMKVDSVAPQIRQLQESVDAMAIELERISESQRFMAKLAAEKAPAGLGAGEKRG